jgi:hypothetical protein
MFFVCIQVDMMQKTHKFIYQDAGDVGEIRAIFVIFPAAARGRDFLLINMFFIPVPSPWHALCWRRGLHVCHFAT